VLAVTDCRIIAASCDVTVLVLRADRADRKLSEMARDGLMSVGANLVGLVMNHVPPGTAVYAGDASYYQATGTNGSRARGGHGAAAAGAGDEHDATPLVAIDAMKSMGKRPNQLSH